MKKNLLILAVFASAAIVGCNKTEGPETYTATITLEAEEGVTIPDGIEFNIVATNFDTKQEKTVKAENNVAEVKGLIAGNYTFMASAEYVSESGSKSIYSGSLTNVSILQDEALAMKIDRAQASTLVLKELYYNCSKTAANKPYMKEQFYEIYNNSEEVVYADGLCFGHLMPESATGLANYDWGAEYPLDKYVFFGRIMQVPGKVGDKNYPVAPGESIILCQYATDHTVPALNPNSINLSSGEFEYYETTNTMQTDQPAVNLKMVYPINPSSPYKIWTMTVNGPAMAMFYPEEDFSVDKVLTDNNNKVTQCYPIPASLILDAVEAIKDETQVKNKRVPTSLDAGYIWVVDDAGEPALQVGKSIVRKVAETREDGRVILQDTNNTTNDFELKKREIRRYGAKIPAWNTWAK